MKKILCCLLVICCVFALFGCKGKEPTIDPIVEPVIGVTPADVPGKVHMYLKTDTEPAKDIYVVQLFDINNDLIDEFELTKNEGFSQTKSVPRGEYKLLMFAQEDMTNEILLKTNNMKVRANSEMEMIIEMLHEQAPDESTPIQSFSTHNLAIISASFKQDGTKKYIVRLTDVNTPENTIDLALQLEDHGWEFSDMVPFGEYQVKAYEIIESGEIEIAVTGNEKTLIVSKDVPFSTMNLKPADSSLKDGGRWTELTDTSGDGTLHFKINVPDGFPEYESILVTLINSTTGDYIDVPAYALNKWTERVTLPAGNYMTFSVIAAGDNPMNPEWEFEIGYKFTLNAGDEVGLTIDSGGSLLHPDNLDGPATNTEIKPEDLMTDEEIAEMQNNNN